MDMDMDMDMDVGMDSTPLSIKASPRKLPIKRKTPSDSNPNPNSNSNSNSCQQVVITPKLESTATDHGGDDDVPRRLPPFKFHRIWTEPDEIRFLQGLLDCSAEALYFPRDLNVFYNRFSNTMSQPYTKTQLSEKLRRLRKKFRVISARLAKGLDKSLLTPHDRDLFEISKQLWHPDYSSTSPFGATNSKLPLKKSDLVGVKVSFSPILPSASIPASNHTVIRESTDHCFSYDVLDKCDNSNEDVKLSEVNVEIEDCVGKEELPSNKIGQVVAKTVIDLFDQSLKEAKMTMFPQAALLFEGKDWSFDKRWQEQRVAEMEVLARRLRLVLEDSLQRH